MPPPFRARHSTGPFGMKAHFTMMAAYNAWANKRLFAAVAEAGDEVYRKDAGAFFGSLHGTLNHLYVTDVLWMARFRGDSTPPWSLDHIAHSPLPELTARRFALDRDICGHVMSLTDEEIEAVFTYRRVSAPDPITQPRREALAHFFNHQTHHRGQAHTILSILGHAPPPLDLLIYQRSL